MKNLGLKYETHIQPWDSKRTENLAGNILFTLYREYYILDKIKKKEGYHIILFLFFKRMVAIIGMIIALWGGNTVFLSLIAGMMNSVLGNIEVDGEPFGLGYKNCLWMIIVAAFLIPITWLGTPKDFWWVNTSFLINI